MSDFIPQRRAFSLIEMLVAMAVLSLLALLIMQIINISASMTSSSARKLEGLAGARFALDRIGMDLASRVKNPEVTARFNKLIGNDEFDFYSEVDAYSGSRKVTAVSYRVSGIKQNLNFQLQRGVKGSDWTDVFPITLPTSEDLQYEVLAEGVLRLEIGYLLKSGQFSTETSSVELTEVAAIIVGVAVLDSSSRKMLTIDQLESLVGILKDPSSPNQKDLISRWENDLQQSELPPRALQNIHFLQRYYYVR